jgi:hypothetical protein
MNKPVLKHHVCEGSDYWASWGSKGWTAVRVIQAKRVFANVARINPKTNETKSRNAKVRLDEMVKRDPKKKGKDKPKVSPAVVFEEVRRIRKTQAAVTVTCEPEPEPEPDPRPALPPGRFSHSFATAEEADAFWRKTWDAVHGEGYWDSLPADDW